jgi:MFS family permease
MKSEEGDYKKKEATLKWTYFDSMFASIKDGINSQFIIPFALALNAGNEYIAMISSTPGLVGSFMQLFVSDILNIVKKRKTIIIFTALIDSILWLPILLIPFLWGQNYILLLNFLIIQAIANSILNPFFNSLLGDVVPEDRRGKFFSRLNQISGIFSFFSSLGAGLILSLLRPTHPYLGFAIIFFVAFISRLLSALVKLRF